MDDSEGEGMQSTQKLSEEELSIVNNELFGKSLDDMKKLLPSEGSTKTDKLKWVDANLKYYSILKGILRDILRGNSRVEDVVERVQGKMKEIVDLSTPVGHARIWDAFEKASETVSHLKSLRGIVDSGPETVASMFSSRIADIDIGIESQDLHHKFDLKLLTVEIEKLFQWHEVNHVRDEFLAPYFVIVQSSGMGKTKLMHEYKKSQTEIATCLLLCSQGATSSVHEELTVPSMPTANAKTRIELTSRLDKILEELTDKETKLVLLVDEAQHLVKGDGFLFRCFRHWLRVKRDGEKGKQVVAVFAGTTSKLTNFYVEKPPTDFSRDSTSLYHENNGKKLYNPFFHLSTCGAGKKDKKQEPNTLTEFRRSIKYGRPLFHVMQKERKLDEEKLELIKRRLLLTSNHETSEVSWLSILAVRVQMGQVSLNIASALISLGYANLTHFQSGMSITEDDNDTAIVQLCHFPDPVLARSAMVAMNDDRKKWSKRAMQLFSTGMCLPEKGDTGEVFAALFLLFCGDELRKEKDENLEEFSVPLKEWLNKMGASHIHGNKENVTHKFVNFIQVCRNYARLDPGEISKKTEFLRELYESGCAIYVFAGAKASDIIVPIKHERSADSPSRKRPFPNKEKTQRTRHGSVSSASLLEETPAKDQDEAAMGVDSKAQTTQQVGDESLEAMLISVKNRSEFTRTQMGRCFASMAKQLVDAGINKGFCLLLLLGMENDLVQTTKKNLSVGEVSGAMEKELDENTLSKLKKSSISCYLVIVEDEKSYGVAEAIRCTTSPGGERAEMHASHFSISQLVEVNEVEKLLRKSLRKSENQQNDDEDLNYTRDLVAALAGSDTQ